MPQYILSQLNSPGPNAYNAYDCMLTHEIEEVLEKLPGANPILDFTLGLQAPVMEMMLRGIRVNIHEIEKQTKKLHLDLEKVEEILKKFYHACCPDKPWELNKLNRPTFPNSTKQLSELFYDVMGIPKIIKHQKGEEKLPMDRDILERIQKSYFQTYPIISAVLAHRDITGTLEVLEAGIDSDQRIRATINIASTSTGRFSSSQSTTGSGQNLQNITADLRSIFIADTGWKIGAIDKEQAESRELGFFCGMIFNDWSYLDAIESGDIHTYTCRLVWPNLPWTGDLKKDKKIAETPFYRHLTHRDMSKRCGHGSNYFGKPYTIANEIRTPQKFVKDFQEAYFEAFPCIQKLHQWVAQEIQTKRYLINIFGRRRDFFDRPEADETLRKAVAFLFQSATADDLNIGLWRIWKHLRGRVQLLLQLHDAVYFQYREDDNEQEVITEVQKLLDVVFYCKHRKFVVPTEPKVGYNFGNRFKLDASGNLIEVNPRGLDKVSWY